MELIMAQAKKSAPKFTPKFATPPAASKTAKTALSAVENSRSSAEHIVKLGSDSTREWIASGTEELQKRLP